MIESVFLDRIKKFEGYTPTAKWDYAQFTNGYGTKARSPDETVTRAEAESRFRAEIGKAAQIVERHAAGWDPGTKAALTSLTFNAGTRWISAGLGDAVRAGDIEAVRERFVLYVNAGGETLQGLVNRRNAEVKWIGKQVAAPSIDALQGRTPPNAVSSSGAWPTPEIAFALPVNLDVGDAMPLRPSQPSKEPRPDPIPQQGSIAVANAERSEHEFTSLIVSRIAESALYNTGWPRDRDDSDRELDHQYIG